MDLEEIKMNLLTYKQQLQQIEAAIEMKPNDSDFIQTRDDLKQLIEILEEDQLSIEKSQLLMMLEDEKDVSTSHNGSKLKNLDPGDDLNEIFLKSIAEIEDLNGIKCQAPYETEWTGTQYHNAMVVTCDDHDEDKNVVDVLFLNPLIEKMKPCPYYLEGSCRFANSDCRFSHGHKTTLTSLRVYKEPDYKEFKKGRSCLAKKSSGIWSRGIINQIEDGIRCTVRFLDENLTLEVNIEEVIPDEDFEDSKDTKDLKQDFTDDSYTSIYNKDASLDQSKPLGAWEEHTRGIGSKIMQKFGYKLGDGLGKNCEGRKLPVPIVVLPPGKSLDCCAEILKNQETKKKKKENCKTKTIVTKKSPGVFNLLNKTLSGRSHQSCSSNDQKVMKKSSFKLKGNKKEELELSQNLVKSQSLIKAKKGEIIKLKTQIKRNMSLNPVVAEQFRRKLQNVSNELRSLESQTAKMESHRNNVKSFREMIKF